MFLFFSEIPGFVSAQLPDFQKFHELCPKKRVLFTKAKGDLFSRPNRFCAMLVATPSMLWTKVIDGTMKGLWLLIQASAVALVLGVLPTVAAPQNLSAAMTPGDARHLLERAGIGAHPDEIEALLGLTRAQAIDAMVDQLDVSAPFNEPP
ncbi:MAG: hypothetical protein VX005_05840, partial [Pseudomonadota bacterium]|nr:hypothetical protein [Pseudomonadota bacterium]